MLSIRTSLIAAVSMLTCAGPLQAACASPNAYLALAAPGGIEALGGLTVGSSNGGNPQQCTGAMLDFGGNFRVAKAAFGVRSFQRYDWPVAAQVDLYVSKPYGSDLSRSCQGLEAGYGALMAMLRLHVGHCSNGPMDYGMALGFFY